MDTKGPAREGDSKAHVRYIKINNMTPRLSGHISIIFGLAFFVLKSLLEIASQWNREKFAILSVKPGSHVRILIYWTWAIGLIKGLSVPSRWEYVKFGICKIKWNCP